MASPETSRTRTLSVADVLRNRIFDGEIPPGSHLMEVTLAQKLGVSRTPVRDALARLSDEGLLTYQPNRGFLVRRFQPKDVRDAFTVRATLESLGCRLIGERGLQYPEQERLASQLEAQRKLLHDEEWTEQQALLWQDMNLEFHCSLLELAENEWLTTAVRRARQLPLIFDSKSRPHDHAALKLLFQREHSRQALSEHYRIVDALVQREVSRAESLMREHILTNRDVLIRALGADASTEALSPMAGGAVVISY